MGKIMKRHRRIFKLMRVGLLARAASVVDAVECAMARALRSGASTTPRRSALRFSGNSFRGEPYQTLHR